MPSKQQIRLDRSSLPAFKHRIIFFLNDGGWTVKSFTDEFGDPVGDTYYQKQAQGIYTTDIMESTGRGTVFCSAYTQQRFSIIITRNSEPITFIFPIVKQFTLAIKDTTDGQIYRFPCISILDNQEFIFSLTGDLARLLHSTHKLEFALSEQRSNKPIVVSSFTMTGNLPIGGD
jgi:hypothetical protein